VQPLAVAKPGLDRVTEGVAEVQNRAQARLALVLRGKRLGFPLEEIRTIVDLYDAPRGKASQLEYAIGQAQVRRAELEARRRDIDESLAELTAFEASCREDLERHS
jgi:DNA-binding transcriptional MerR regulator